MSNGKQLTVTREMLTAVARDQSEQLKVAWSAFHLYGKTGGNFQTNGTLEMLTAVARDQSEQLKVAWSAFHLYGKTGENFPPNETVQPLKRFSLVWKNRWQFSDKWNSTSFSGFGSNKPRIFMKEHGSSVMRQMVQ